MKILKWMKNYFVKPSSRTEKPESTATQIKSEFVAYLKILSSQTGYVYAGNEYLAGKFGVTVRTIQRWLKNAETAGSIRLDYSNRSRRIYVVEETEMAIKPQSSVSWPPRHADTPVRRSVTPPRHSVAPYIEPSKTQKNHLHQVTPGSAPTDTDFLRALEELSEAI